MHIDDVEQLPEPRTLAGDWKLVVESTRLAKSTQREQDLASFLFYAGCAAVLEALSETQAQDDGTGLDFDRHFTALDTEAREALSRLMPLFQRYATGSPI